jgi:hypothetical protein
MSWTIADAITHARQTIQDTREAAYRHSDDKLVGYFNAAIADARKLRPDIFLQGTDASLWDAVPLYTAQDLTDLTPFPLDPQYFTAVVDHIAGTIGMEDDEYAVDGRAAGLLTRFSQKLVGKGA